MAAAVDVFTSRRAGLPGGPQIQRLRDLALERFGALGFPTTHNEAWRYTNLAPHLKKDFAAPTEFDAVPEPLTADHYRLAFVNGRFAPEHSVLPQARGLRVGSVLEGGAIGSEAAFDDNALVALNTALFEDGALVEITDGAVIDKPIELYFLSSGPVATFPRNLIVAGRDSQAQIVEIYAGGDGFTNAVTEFAAAEGSVIEHYKYQQEGPATLHFGMLAVRQANSTNFTSHNLALGAALARNEIAVVLDGEGAECTLNGLYVTDGRQHVDNYTTLDHARPHSASHELYKGVLDGSSHAVFHGRIIVRPEAQKTDAIQRNRNLLLSKSAVIDTKPQLEIYADDVKCTHGATVGQVDADAVFYLRSRGIPDAEARALLTYAFTADVVEKIKIESIRTALRGELFRRLAGRDASQL